jgi:type III secretory pathway component EscU
MNVILDPLVAAVVVAMVINVGVHFAAVVIANDIEKIEPLV